MTRTKFYLIKINSDDDSIRIFVRSVRTDDTASHVPLASKSNQSKERKSDEIFASSFTDPKTAIVIREIFICDDPLLTFKICHDN